MRRSSARRRSCRRSFPGTAPSTRRTSTSASSRQSTTSPEGGFRRCGRCRSARPSSCSSELCSWRGRRRGTARRPSLPAGVLLATSIWLLTQGRWACDVLFTSALVTWSAGAALSAARTGSRLAAVLSGLLLGLAQYGYVQSRLAFLAPLPWPPGPRSGASGSSSGSRRRSRSRRGSWPRRSSSISRGTPTARPPTSRTSRSSRGRRRARSLPSARMRGTTPRSSRTAGTSSRATGTRRARSSSRASPRSSLSRSRSRSGAPVPRGSSP